MAELFRLPDATQITVRCSAAVLNAVGASAGLEFPRAANRFAISGTTTILWAGPDNWLVIAEACELISTLEAAFAGHNAAVVDVSGNRVRFCLSGAGARDMMARSCAIDFDPPHVGVGHCAATLVARAQAFVLQRDDCPSYELLVRRSYAKYLVDWFATAGCEVT